MIVLKTSMTEAMLITRNSVSMLGPGYFELEISAVVPRLVTTVLAHFSAFSFSFSCLWWVLGRVQPCGSLGLPFHTRSLHVTMLVRVCAERDSVTHTVCSQDGLFCCDYLPPLFSASEFTENQPESLNIPSFSFQFKFQGSVIHPNFIFHWARLMLPHPI